VAAERGEERTIIIGGEIEEAVKRLKRGKSPGINNILGELIQEKGELTIELLHKLCNVFWETRCWPQQWTH